MPKKERKSSGRSGPTIVDRLSVTEMRELVFSDNDEAQAWFAKVFSADIRSTIRDLTDAWNRYRALADEIAEQKRPAEVLLFVHVALNSIFTALHLLVSGYAIPAGNLMRQYAESVAMAMLCADESLDVFERYTSNRQQYPTHKALDLITREKVSRTLQKSLHLDKQGYAGFVSTMKFYDNLSHASAITLGYTFMFSKMGGLILGAQADPKKHAQYRREIRLFGRAASTVRDLVEILDSVLAKKPPHAAA